MNSSPVVPGKVAFLIAGVQKGGTTALFDYLAEHPDLALPACKEAHFFDDETIDWAAPDYEPYHALFAGLPAAANRLWGEATPIYAYWPDSLARIAAYNPAMRLILLFRDPVERAWSHWRMETARGVETEPFGWCIRQGRQRVRDNPAHPGVDREHSYVERGFYGEQLSRALALFPRDRLLALRSEALAHDPIRILGTVCDFLHVPHFETIRPRRSHVGSDTVHPSRMDSEDRRLLSEIYAEDQIIFRNLSNIDFRT